MMKAHTGFDRSRDFRFGLEAEYLLIEAQTTAPLWHPDLSFEKLNSVLEKIPLDGMPSLDGLDLEPPHQRVMPYVVEGYHVPDKDFNMVDILPKGVEIRTPVTTSVEECLDVFKTLYHRLQIAMETCGYRAAALSHHPTESKFRGLQNKRRHDFWLWAMEVMTTYGPDVNVSLPKDLNDCLDLVDFEAKVNYYAPAMGAFSVASPFLNGELWKIRGQVGKSFRTYRRSVIAPPIEIHPDEGGRLEFKVFEMSWRMDDYQNYFLLFLSLLLDDELKGRASQQSRVYDQGTVARFGLQAPEIHGRAGEILSRAPGVLKSWGFDPRSLVTFEKRFDQNRVPADELIEIFSAERGGIGAVLRHVSRLEDLSF